jgi:hypothetical protein
MDRLFPENWPLIRALPPYKRGVVDSLVSMLILTVVLWLCFAELDVRAKAEALRTVAEIGATLLVAYGLIASSIISAAKTEPSAKRKERLGAFVGIGTSGLIGIANALVLSERAWVSNPSWLEELAFGWTSASLLMFLVFVAFQADALESWSKPTRTEGRSRWLTRNRRRSN